MKTIQTAHVIVDLAKQITESFYYPLFLNYDNLDDRKIIQNQA